MRDFEDLFKDKTKPLISEFVAATSGIRRVCILPSTQRTFGEILEFVLSLKVVRNFTTYFTTYVLIYLTDQFDEIQAVQTGRK